MKSKRFVGVVMCGIVLSVAVETVQAATIRYRQTGDWTLTAPTNTGPGWQNVSEVPTIADVGRINWGGGTGTVTTTEEI